MAGLQLGVPISCTVHADLLAGFHWKRAIANVVSDTCAFMCHVKLKCLFISSVDLTTDKRKRKKKHIRCITKRL